MTATDVAAHCMEIERCNQRGGRMLSVVDLVDADAMPVEMAAYALAAVGAGASFLVGALPGGAGKTTVMGALLNLLPAGVSLAAADGMGAIRRGLETGRPRQCYICHEIGRGRYYAYLWGDALRAYFDLAAVGHMLATNLHADTYEQARGQICGDNAVDAAALRRMNLMFFLSVTRAGPSVRRRIETVWESDGASDHRCLWRAGDGADAFTASRLTDPNRLAAARETLDALLATGRRTIAEVRAFILDGRRGAMS